MLLHKIEFQNFRQFYGEQSIEFSVDEVKNLTLIHSENGVGKTTILNAILWCFYEKTSSEFENPEDLINHEADDQGVKDFNVSLTFEYEKKTYRATRFGKKGQISSTDNFKCWDISDGNFKPLSSAYVLINQIVPKDLADYFFFAGEEIGKVAGGTTAKTVKEVVAVKKAIRDILGLSLAEQAVEDLIEIKKIISREVAKLSVSSVDVPARQIELEQVVDRLKKLRDEFQESETNESVFNTEISQINKYLINAPAVAEFQQNRLKYENQLEAKKNQIEALKTRLVQAIGKYGWAVFGKDISDQSLDFIDEETLKGKIPSPHNERLVNDLLEAKMCLCKRPLSVGSPEYAAIRELLQTASTAVIFNRLLECRAYIQEIQSRAIDSADGFSDIQAQINSLGKEIGALEAQIKEFTDRINASPVDEIKNKELRRKNLEADLRALLIGRGALQSRINTSQTAITNLESEIKKAVSTQPALSAINQKISLLDNLIKYAERRISADEKKSTRVLMINLNKTLEEFSRKNYTAVLDEATYKLNLQRQDGRKVGKSKGEKLLLSLSFITTLIDYAAQRVGRSTDFISGGTVAPFVIDAPFGELDDTYRTSIASLLPRKARQVVLLLSSSNWKGAVDQQIKSYVGREYILINHTTGLQDGTGKPEDLLELQGKTIHQTIYSEKFDYTSIQEIK